MRIEVPLVCCLAVLTASAQGRSPYHTAKVTVCAVDEGSAPVSNATAVVEFNKNIPQGEGWGIRPFTVEGITDTNGLFVAEASGNPSVSCGAKKDGFYPTWGVSFSFTNESGGRWQPWNPTVLVPLRKVGDPVPMYAKHVDTMIPEVNTPCAYDLEKGDWMQPHGKGIHGDIVVELSRRITNENDYEGTLSVSFPGIGNGIQETLAIGAAGSILRLSATAPADTYRSNVVVRWGRSPSQGGYGNIGDDYRPNYFFRIRSEVDDKGNVIRAQYGKVHGAFRVSGLVRKDARVSFVYYLNPDGTRNVEFDPTKNLFTNLSSLEEVRAP